MGVDFANEIDIGLGVFLAAERRVGCSPVNAP